MIQTRNRAIFRSLVAVIALAVPHALNAADAVRVGTIVVQRHGGQGSALVLIPGLACGGWVWDDVVSRLKKDHILYVVTLPGFDGVSAAQGKLIDGANESLLELIRSRKITRPVLVGHSLGGTLAIRFAQEHSDMISGVVAVDGLPVLPGTENLPAEQRNILAGNIRRQMAAMTAEQFAAQQLQYMKTLGVLDESRAIDLASRLSRSDPGATAQYMAEDIGLDLRAGLSLIKVPVLEICPVDTRAPANSSSTTKAAKIACYQALLKGIPKIDVVSIEPSRHFVMIDQPEAFAAALNHFLTIIQSARKD